MCAVERKLRQDLDKWLKSRSNRKPSIAIFGASNKINVRGKQIEVVCKQYKERNIMSHKEWMYYFSDDEYVGNEE